MDHPIRTEHEVSNGDGRTLLPMSADLALDELFLGRFRRALTGTRFPLPPPWVAAMGEEARWLFAFEVVELPEVVCLTTDRFVEQRLYPVLNIPREEPGALLVVANRASKYRPVPVDAQHRVNLTETGDFFGSAESSGAVSVVLYGGADHFGVCEEARFPVVERRLEQEERKLSRWLEKGAIGPTVSP